ncbi:uncharacterized protein EDB93DRAFT_1248744 [Suillus bovinus]|uniref:uncharacterized protein n=1 Tax=Suillus bovinus TaxID=48563 RepID=UPI001B874692|nr:uncharacterized protein EDB93DRAFT_1248744 [Suillus bovinus]KAG2153480.1 hypothetical protein EDB93DRAFT_1248744 [Suillus bovinus]
MFTPPPTFGKSHQGDDLPLPISFHHLLPAAAAMQQAPMFTPIPTFSQSHQGNDSPSPISLNHSLLGAAAMQQAPMFTPLPTFNENHHWPPSAPSDHMPSTTIDYYNGTLLPPFIVLSQNPIYLNDLASLPSVLANYRCNFPPPLLSMDGVTMLPPAAPNYIRPQPFTSVPSSTTPSHLTPTQPTQPQIDLPPLDYQSNLPIHNAFILAMEKELIRDAVNNCTMIKPSLREGLVQAALANAVQDCLKKTQSDLAGLANKEIEEFGQRWAAKNVGLLYMDLSVLFRLLMAACKELAFGVVD